MDAASQRLIGQQAEGIHRTREVLRQWLNEREGDLSPDNSIHLHLDELARRLGRPRHDPVQDILQPYLLLIDLLDGRLEELIPAVQFSLRAPKRRGVSMKELMVAPTLKSLAKDLNDEPPAIYVAYRRMYLLQPLGEVYCRHLKWEPFNEKREDVSFYYRIDGVKGVPFYEDGPSYLRSVVGRQYPSSLRRHGSQPRES